MQFALDWWLVQPAVGKTTRACSYDRGGLGWSDPAPRFENPELIVSDLKVLRTRLAFQRRAFETSQAQTVADQIRDFESRRVTAERLHSADAALGSLPVIVLTADRANLPPLTRVGPAKTAALSSNSARRLVKSTPMIHLDAPSIVVKAIGEVVNAVRTNNTLESPP